MPDEEEELELPEDGDLEAIEYCYGIELPSLPPDLHPLECVVLIQGIDMETGQPTITAIGSEGMAPWTAVGLLRMEAARLEHGYVFGGIGSGFETDGDEEDEDDP